MDHSDPITGLSLSNDAHFYTLKFAYNKMRTDTIEGLRDMYEDIMNSNNEIRITYVMISKVDSGTTRSGEDSPIIWPCGSVEDVPKVFEKIMNWKGEDAFHYVRVYVNKPVAAVEKAEELKCECDQSLKHTLQFFCTFCKIQRRKMYGYLD